MTEVAAPPGAAFIAVGGDFGVGGVVVGGGCSGCFKAVGVAAAVGVAVFGVAAAAAAVVAADVVAVLAAASVGVVVAAAIADDDVVHLRHCFPSSASASCRDAIVAQGVRNCMLHPERSPSFCTFRIEEILFSLVSSRSLLFS